MSVEQVEYTETTYGWDDFKAAQAKLKCTEAETCPYCYTPKVEIDGVVKCPAGCDDDPNVRPNWKEILRSPGMQKVVDSFAKAAFGRTNSESVATATCVCCGGDASTFRDALSRKEFGISGMCQKCQDSVFDA